VSVAVVTPEATMTAPPPRGQRRRRWTRFVLPSYVALVILYLMTPIFMIVLYGFNQTGSARRITVSYVWHGFTLDWYRHLFQIPDLTRALQTSLLLAASSMVIATVLGTLVALALVRYRFRGRGTADVVLFANIAAPEIVLGASLLSLFVLVNVGRGFLTLLIAHVMFSIAYVTVTVRTRLAGFDRSLEEAAQDLGAGPITTFRLVTLPLIFPGILAGALLAFALSIDDFVITQFNAGQQVTFPLWVYGVTRVGIPPQVFVMATLIFVFGVLLALSNALLQRRKA
jgi:spermidine/putrescine transport system permease protein